MEEILAGRPDAPRLHGHGVRHLDHPRRIGIRRDARNMDLPTAQRQNKYDVVRNLQWEGEFEYFDYTGSQVLTR